MAMAKLLFVPLRSSECLDGQITVRYMHEKLVDRKIRYSNVIMQKYIYA